MAHRQLSRPLLRYLKILDASDPSPQNMADVIQPSLVVDDFADVASPHQNPFFTDAASRAAIAAVFLVITLRPTIRPLRVWKVQGTFGNDVRALVRETDPISANRLTLTPQAFGPEGITVQTSTAVVQSGSSAGAQSTAGYHLASALAASSVLGPDLGVPRGLLIAPGQFLSIYNTTVNDTIAVNLLWEEIPRYGELTNVGFPVPS